MKVTRFGECKKYSPPQHSKAKIPAHSFNAPSLLGGELEMHESCFGGLRKGKLMF